MQPRTILLFATLAGCWQGGQGTQVTSLDTALVIGDLTEAQFSQLCREIDHWNQAQFGSDKFRAAACEIEAATALRQQSSTPLGQEAVCHDRARQCQSARAGKPAVEPQCQRDADGCPLPISEIEQCLFEVSYDMNQVLCTAPVCDDLCAIVDRRAVEPPSCAAIRVTCPGLRFTRPPFDGLVSLPPCPGAGPATRVCVWR
jgi:hypothetical protein